MKNASICRFLTALVAWFLSFASAASAANTLNYQGRVISGGTAFTGAGQFKFALVSADGSTVYWKNDGTTDAAAPTTVVPLTVTKGIFGVRLGDTAFSNMAAISSSVFSNTSMALRIWFNDGVKGFQQLSPDQTVSESALTTVRNANSSNSGGWGGTRNTFLYSSASPFGPFNQLFPVVDPRYGGLGTQYWVNIINTSPIFVPVESGFSKILVKITTSCKSFYSTASGYDFFWYGSSTKLTDEQGRGRLKVSLEHLSEDGVYSSTQVYSRTGGVRLDGYYGWDVTEDTFFISTPNSRDVYTIAISIGADWNPSLDVIISGVGIVADGRLISGADGRGATNASILGVKTVNGN
jgi:hypothetical protein